MTETERIQKLQRPHGKIDLVLDTDAFNEIDDQFAIAYMMLLGEKFSPKAIMAAPFFNARSTGPADGMEKSYQEILNLLKLMGREDFAPQVFRGSKEYLPDEHTPVDSPAARRLVELAREYSPEHPLYVAAIGAITNVASAILMEPSIVERIVLVWLGGHARHWPDNKEFNLHQDIAAARVVFGCGVPLVQLPCMGVVSELRTTKPELAYWLKGKNALCDYLYAHTCEEAESYAAGKPWSRVIWDISVLAFLADEEGWLVKDCCLPATIPEYGEHWAFDMTRHSMGYVWQVNRDAIFEELFTLLAK